MLLQIEKAVTVLRQGGIIAFPTETTYGLGCDPRKKEAVERIFCIKGRDPQKPLLLVAGSWEQVERVAFMSVAARRVAEQHWPGPLTLVLPIAQEVGLVQGVCVHGEVAVRFSSSPLVQELTTAFGFPVVATSANLANQPDSRSAEDVRAYNLQVDYIIDGGRLLDSKPSTVARVEDTGEIQVIRAGAISLVSL